MRFPDVCGYLPFDKQMISLLYRLADAARQHRRSAHATIEQANGRRGEDIAHRYLQRHGLTVVSRNFRPRSGNGELDIVAWDRETLVFVEVKARSTDEFGSPARAVGRAKEDELRRAAREYMHRRGVDSKQARFDLFNIVLSNPPQIEWVKDAFAVSRKI